MTGILQGLSLSAFVAVMAMAAFEDFRRLVIPNLLPILLCALWPFYIATTGVALSGIGAALICAALVFVVGAVLFSRGLLGGGDVKLLSAATLWAGPAGTAKLLMLTCAFGGVLALFMLLPFGRCALVAARRMLGQPPAIAGSGLSIPIPYGIAIAAAAVVVIRPPFTS
jgi:prepilin peptidase CpaA